MPLPRCPFKALQNWPHGTPVRDGGEAPLAGGPITSNFKELRPTVENGLRPIGSRPEFTEGKPFPT